MDAAPARPERPAAWLSIAIGSLPAATLALGQDGIDAWSMPGWAYLGLGLVDTPAIVSVWLLGSLVERWLSRPGVVLLFWCVSSLWFGLLVHRVRAWRYGNRLREYEWWHASRLPTSDGIRSARRS